MKNDSIIGAVILAAGESKRLGTPKQLLQYKNKTLLHHIIESALNSKCQKTIVVIGAYAEKVKKHVNKLPIDIIENQNWKEGKASSIRMGLKTLTSQTDNVNAAIFLACDQPFISSDVIDCIIETYKKTKSAIVASKYADTTGVPALFDRKYFSEILALKGDQGAKAIIASYHEQVATISFQKGAIDIDTIEDLNQHRNNESATKRRKIRL